MQMRAMVVDDITREFDAEKGAKQAYRRLMVVDQSDVPCVQKMEVAVPVETPILGPGKDGASIKNCVVDLVVKDYELQLRKNAPVIVFRGDVVKIHGVQTITPFKGFEAKKETVKAAA